MATTAGRAPILECVRAGFALLARDWRAILPVALIGAVVLTPVQVWADAATAANDGGGRLLAMLVGLLVQIPVLAAFYRRALSNGAAPLALRLGVDELALARATMATLFVVFIATMIGIMVISMALAALAAGADVDPAAFQKLPPAEAAQAFLNALGPDGRIVLIGLGAALLGFLVWLSARLALASPATVDAGRPRVFETWAGPRAIPAPWRRCC